MLCNLVHLLCLECFTLSISAHHVCNSSDMVGESCNTGHGGMIGSLNKYAGI